MKRTLLLSIALSFVASECCGQRRSADLDAERRQTHQEFRNFVEGVVGKSSSAVANERELGDLRTLQWLFRDYRKHIADGNWNAADSVKKRMNVALQRMEVVAADAPRRQDDQKQKQEDRRHRDLKKQLERQHRELMQQQQRQHQEQMTRQHLVCTFRETGGN